VSFKRLLAKTSATPEAPRFDQTLAGHTRDVLAVRESIMLRLGDVILKSLGLEAHFTMPQLDATLTAAVRLHDLGKVNSDFQTILRNPGVHIQAFRHEWLSIWLTLQQPTLRSWLLGDEDTVWSWAAQFAALGHHLKLQDGSQLIPNPASNTTSISFFLNHEDFAAAIEMGGERGERPCRIPKLDDIVMEVDDRSLHELRRWLVDAVTWYGSQPPKVKIFVSAVKALMIACDVAGSALCKGMDGHKALWVEFMLSRVSSETELAEIAQTRLRGNLTRPFQEKVAESSGRVTFVKAGCGSGKTVAAYLWAAKQAPGRKLFFCYPTTNTATEGFGDYVLSSGLATEARLLHSRSAEDLEDILDVKGDNPSDKMLKLEALASWDTPLVLCTVDLVLGLMQNSRRSLFQAPSLLNGAFVFDEVHQFDDRLYGALLEFLRAFRGTPVLLMTASLPPNRLAALKETLEALGDSLVTIQGAPELESLPRYVLKDIGPTAPWDEVQAALEAGGKVLWVCNTVGRAMAFAREAEGRGLGPALLYHSRYRYMDRVQRHRDVIGAFKSPEAPALAITTQVCEVSLDLSADLMVTDMAPVPALIQRLGRLNRLATPEAPGNPRPAYFLEPQGTMPYGEELNLRDVRRWLRQLGGRPVSQADLASEFEAMAGNEPVPSVRCEWLEGGPFAAQAPLREAGATVPVIMSEDLQRCLDASGKPIQKQVSRYSIPMPLRPVAQELQGWRSLGFAFAAPEGQIEYDEQRGAKWAKR